MGKGRDNLRPRDIALKTNMVKLREPAGGTIKMEFPARPLPGDFSSTPGPSGSKGIMGDDHAIMADGEPTGTGAETSMDVEFSVEISQSARVNGPRVSSSLDRGLQVATTDMSPCTMALRTPKKYLKQAFPMVRGGLCTGWIRYGCRRRLT